jgi:ABC-type sugar transport system ATPase subunit
VIVEELGFEQLVHFATDAHMIASESEPHADNELAQLGTSIRGSECIARADARIQMKTGDRVEFGIAPHALHFFDPVGGGSIDDAAKAEK